MAEIILKKNSDVVTCEIKSFQRCILTVVMCETKKLKLFQKIILFHM